MAQCISGEKAGDPCICLAVYGDDGVFIGSYVYGQREAGKLCGQLLKL